MSPGRAIAGELEPKLGRDFRLAALIHDAPEYVIGDLISPFKAALARLRAFEAKLLAAIHVRFGLPAELPDDVVKVIKRADKIAAYFEATGLPAFSRGGGAALFRPAAGLERSAGCSVFRSWTPLPASRGEAAFLKRFNELHR